MGGLPEGINYISTILPVLVFGLPLLLNELLESTLALTLTVGIGG